MRKNFYNFIISISQKNLISPLCHRKFNFLKLRSFYKFLDRKIEIIKCIFNSTEKHFLWSLYSKAKELCMRRVFLVKLKSFSRVIETEYISGLKTILPHELDSFNNIVPQSFFLSEWERKKNKSFKCFRYANADKTSDRKFFFATVDVPLDPPSPSKST